MSAQQLEAILQMAAQNPPPAQATPAQLRAWFDASNSQMPLAQGLPIQALRIPNGAGGTMTAELHSTPQADPRKLVDGLGTRWTLAETSFKYHASCRHTHPAADALLAQLRAGDVA